MLHVAQCARSSPIDMTLSGAASCGSGRGQAIGRPRPGAGQITIAHESAARRILALIRADSQSDDYRTAFTTKRVWVGAADLLG